MTPPTTQEAGLKLVPTELSVEMLAEFMNIDGPWSRGQMTPQEVWSALLSAAPSPEPMQADLRGAVERLSNPDHVVPGAEHCRLVDQRDLDAVLAAVRQPLSNPQELADLRETIARIKAFAGQTGAAWLYADADAILAAMQAKSEPVAWDAHLSIAETVIATLQEEVPALDAYDEDEIAALETSVAMAVRPHLTVAHPSPSAPNPDLAGLVEAMEPFVRAAGKLDGLWSEDDWRWNDGTRSCVTVGELRRAASLLASLK